jgi:hypothetical protein
MSGASYRWPADAEALLDKSRRHERVLADQIDQGHAVRCPHVCRGLPVALQ